MKQTIQVEREQKKVILTCENTKAAKKLQKWLEKALKKTNKRN